MKYVNFLCGSIRNLIPRDLIKNGLIVTNWGGAIVSNTVAECALLLILATLRRVSQEKQIHLGIDVYETEPLPKDSPLRGLPNTTLLPHLGGPTPDRRCDYGELVIQNTKNYLNDDPLINVVNLEAYDRAT